MFLKQLYGYSKTGCIIVVTFLLAFIYINFKWGIVAAPVFQYGMYSSPVHISDTQTVYMVEANKKIINGAELSFTDRDIVQLSLADYEREGFVNETVYNTMHRFLGFTGMMDHYKFINHTNDTGFTKWYHAKLEKITGSSIDSLAVYKQHFLWQQNTLQPSGAPIKLTFIVP